MSIVMVETALDLNENIMLIGILRVAFFGEAECDDDAWLFHLGMTPCCPLNLMDLL